MRMKESEKTGLKLNIQKTKVMAPGSFTSWQTDGGKAEAVTDFSSRAPKSVDEITAAMKLEDTCCLEGRLWQT